MIEKLLDLKNLGVFGDALSGRAVDLGKRTIIYAENGRGKTTLARLLASLATGDCSNLKPMAAIGSGAQPSAELLVTGSHHRLRGYSWTPPPVVKIAVFDTDFVKRNVYTGTSVGPEHRRNLCGFALGEEGVELAEKVDSLNDEIKELTRKIGNVDRELQGVVSGLMTVDQFLGLTQDPDVDAKVAEAQKVVQAARDADIIRHRAELKPIELQFDPALEQVAVLASTLDDVASDAAERTRRHIDERLGAGGEEWLAVGVGFLRDERCPFCDQDIGKVSLVDAFRAYFGEAYAELRQRVEASAKAIEASCSELLLQQIRALVADNQRVAQDWASYVSLPDLGSPLESVEAAMAAMRSGLLPAFERKKSNLLSVAEQDEPITRVRDLCDAAAAGVASYNRMIEEANGAIRRCKAGASGSNLSEVEDSLNRLQLQRKRWEPEVAERCAALNALRLKKKAQEQAKAKAKRQLDQHMKRTMASYGSAVGDFLRKCNAAFRIVDMQVGFSGGAPRADYSIELFGRSASVAAKATDEPHFDTMLSDGDRRTLALAFFLARLEDDPAIADRIVVLDDPGSSLDTHRTSCTVEAVVGLAELCAQLIVMTHDSRLAMELSDGLTEAGMAREGNLVVLQLSREGRHSTIRACYADDLNQTVWQTRIETLETFAARSTDISTLDAVTSIRPAIEGLLRLKYPREFHGAKQFGSMAKRIEEADCESRIHRLKGHVKELYAVCSDYGSPYMHVDRPHSTAVPGDADALAWVKRALQLIDNI